MRKLYIHYIKVPYQSLCRVLAYIPIIWQIRDWDHAFATQLFAFTLRRLYKSIEGGHEVEDSKRVKLRKLLTMINILDRMSNDYHQTAQFEEFERKWGESEFRWEECENHPKLGRLTTMVDARKEKLDEGQKTRYEKEHRQILPIAEKRYENEQALLFKIWKSNFRSFWE